MEESDGVREESEEVITNSRMWFLLWVGKVTSAFSTLEVLDDNHTL